MSQTHDLSRAESTSISVSAASHGPWMAAAAGGVGVAGISELIHLIGFHFTIAEPLALGVATFIVIGWAGALFRASRDRSRSWAQSHPWAYALPAAAGAGVASFAIHLFLSTAGVFSSMWDGAWDAAWVFAIIGLAGYLARAVRSR